MLKAFEYYSRTTDFLMKLILAVSGVIIGLDVISILAEAVGRCIIGSSRAFMEEFPRLLMPFVTFPMMGVLLKLNRHINVEVLPEKLSGRPRNVLMAIIYLVVIFVAAQFFMAGLSAVAYLYKTGFETQTEIILPVWITYLPFPVGFGFLVLFAFELLWREVISFIKPPEVLEK